MPLVPLLLQAPSGAIPSSPIELVLSASTVTQVVLVVLACPVAAELVDHVRRVASLSGGDERGRQVREGVRARDANRGGRRIGKARLAERAAETVLRAMHFVSDARVGGQQIRERARHPARRVDAPPSATLSGSQIETLHLMLDTEASDERDRIGRFLPWLATIGSVSPLIGLLGTVLGVIEAFLGIASKGSGNLSAVAPGVAEALIATAAALSVAIPATFGYNIFATGSIVSTRMESFGTAVIALLVREGRI